MKKLLQAAGVAGLVFLSAAGCSSTCCSRSTTANAGPSGQYTPGTTTTTTSGMPMTTTTTPMTTAGKPPMQTMPAMGITAPTSSPVVMPPQ